MDKCHIEKLSSLPEKIDINKIFNINIGILGHIDSGKTSLAKALSTVASTASFDKNPQSQERGITLDLGFSAFYIKTPAFIKERFPKNERLVQSEILQITLVDCPGHASLIRTVIAGASIIDIIVLVIDIVKGIQVQTTECLILGEILVDNIVVALNKIDTIPQEKRSTDIEIRINKLKSAFGNTKFGKEVCVCPVSASPNENLTSFLDNLIYNIVDKTDFYRRNYKDKFLFSIDHCFNIKNKGTIVTGTILQGKVSINDEIFFPALQEKKMVKEIQMFKKSTTRASQGDRIGMLIKNLDHTKIERTIACTEGYVQNHEGGIYLIKKIKYYKQEIKSNSKLYLIVGNQGVMSKCLFFNMSSIDPNSLCKFEQIDSYKFNYNNEYIYNDSLEHQDNFTFAYMKFDNKLLLQNDMIVLGSKIDFDVSHKSNRIAFYGKMIDNLSQISKLKIFKTKVKQGKILRLQGSNKNAIVIGLFKKDSNIDDFVGKTVKIKNSDITGIIQSKFGQSGKVKVEFTSDIHNLKVKNDDNTEIGLSEIVILLEFKKFVKLL